MSRTRDGISSLKYTGVTYKEHLFMKENTFVNSCLTYKVI